ncbi:MAG: hypothetical protein NVSMB23_00940 [Myxococcales bacterium]
MPGCQFSREERAGRVIYTLRGKLDGACAWELRSRIEDERSGQLSLDFSQVSEFADYGVAVLAQAFDDKPGLEVVGLRQHTLRVFRYFGVDCAARGAPAVSGPSPRRAPERAATREVG